MKAFIGTAASNAHLHQIGQALEESGDLARYMLPFGGWPLAKPVLFTRRSPTGVPKAKLVHFPAWEIARVAAAKLRAPETVVDRIWEEGELAFDISCAAEVRSGRPDLFLGVEHGALQSLKAARQAGASAGLIFPSVHHKFREKWLGPELAKFPELLGGSATKIRARDADRDSRRDDEMGEADFLHANSETTARSLAEAGFPRDRILTVPLGSPPVAPERSAPAHPVVIFAGSIAPHKGAHILLEAWKSAGGGRRGRLEMFGNWALPQRMTPSEGDGVLVHGRVPGPVLREAMRRASVLVLPSICDGFGMVVSEAMAQGLPVICSSNAGASQLIVEGRNGLVVPPADAFRLAAVIDWCLDHPGELFGMGKYAAETAAQWTWSDFRGAFSRGVKEMAERTRHAK